MNFDQIVAALIAGDITAEFLENLCNMSIDDLKCVEQMARKKQPHPYQLENVLKVLMHCGYYDGAKYPFAISDIFRRSYYDAIVGSYVLIDGKIYTNQNQAIPIRAIMSTMPNLRNKTHLLVEMHGKIYLNGVRYSYKKCAGVNIVVADYDPEELKPENIFMTIHHLSYESRLILQTSHLKELKHYDNVMTSYYSILDEGNKINYILSIDNFERYPFFKEHLTVANMLKALKEKTLVEKIQLLFAMPDEDIEKYETYGQDDELIARIQRFKKYHALIGDDISLFCKVFGSK